MGVVKKFNGLNGATVSRTEVENLIVEANQQEQFHLSKRLQSVLSNSGDEFVFDIDNPEIEAARESLLNCFECDFSDDPKGLNKPVSPNEIYEMITNKIINALELPLDFKQEWGSFEDTDGGYLIGYNFDSKKPYRGINAVMLNSFKLYIPSMPLLENPYYLTFKQIEERKGKIRKGAKGQQVIYFTNLYKLELADRGIHFTSSDLAKVKAHALQMGVSPQLISTIPILKYYNVFNGKDIDGINFDLENFKGRGKVAPAKALKNNQLQPIPVAEEIIKHFPKPAPQIRFGGDRAFFRPSADLVQMPKLQQFEYVQAYYTTLFHELIHATGSKTRLDRTGGKKFGDKDYSFEELIAELGASFLSSEAGILHYTFRNSAAYIKGWRKVLLTHVKDDNKFFFRAASQAQKAVDFMLDRDQNGVAAYEKTFKPEVEKISVEKVKESTAVQSKKTEKKSKTKKHDPNQLSLLAAKKQKRNEALRSPEAVEDIEVISDPEQSEITVVEETQVQPTISVPDANIIPGSRADRRNKPKVVHDYYIIPNADHAEFLGEVEKKKTESVVITLAGAQGSGKTRYLFQLINIFGQNYKCGHASMEEHPDSALYTLKENQYINSTALNNLFAPEVKTLNDLDALIRNSDVIFIDSFAKLRKIAPGIALDEDLRKKYNGKLFIIIFQLTADEKMRGGADNQFDGDIILFTKKCPNYKDSYIWPDKNRYNLTPTDELKFNIFLEKMVKPKEETPVPEPTKEASPAKLSFQIVER